MSSLWQVQTEDIRVESNIKRTNILSEDMFSTSKKNSKIKHKNSTECKEESRDNYKLLTIKIKSIFEPHKTQVYFKLI